MNVKTCLILLLLSAASLAAETKDVMTEQDFANVLSERFSAQPVSTYKEQESWGQKRKSTFEGSFELETSLSWNPKIKVRYRVPQTPQNKPIDSADNLVCLCLWFGAAGPPRMRPVEELIPKPAEGKRRSEKEIARERAEAEAKERVRVEHNEGLNGSMSAFSDGLGFTTFSLEIVTKDMGDKREAYFYGGPEWVDVVRRARAEIIKRHHLKDKKLFLYGTSMGGSFAARLAVAMGDEIAGVAIQITPEMTLPTARSSTAWLVGVTRGDSGRQANEELVKTLRTLGTPCVYAIMPPVYGTGGAAYHSVSQVAQRAGFMFLKGVAERQDARGENDPPRWPFVRDTGKPLLIRRNEPQIAAQIPAAQREYMPSREFVQALQSMPVPMQTVAMDPRDPGRSLCMVGLPPLGRPKGAIVFSDKYQFADLPALLNDINFLAEHGYVVLAPRMSGKGESALVTALSFVERSRTLAGLPLSFIGMGAENEALWKLLLAQHHLRPAAHVPINFESGNLLDQSKWPLGAKVEWPTLFLYDQKDFDKLETADEARKASAKLQSVQSFVQSQQQRNQVAAVRFVPLGQKSEAQTAQKSIETALQFIDASVAGKIRSQFK